MLYVAGDNTAAIGLYSSIGMTVTQQDEVFVGIIS
jgi:ribosomal protein S18 acetylase RimI-like enzyme